MPATSRPAVAGLRRAGAELGARLITGPRLLPGLVVIGGKRCGSTSVFEYALRHPAVMAPRVKKGTHYFDVNYHRGWSWFCSKFPTEAAAQRRAAQVGAYPVTAEASPYYLSHPLAAARIAARLPEARLVAVLRDPVERAWSHYRYSIQHGHESLAIDEALDREEERLAGEVERLRADPRYTGQSFRHHGYVRRGLYAQDLRAVYEHVPPERVLVLKSEDLFLSPVTAMARVFEFLGLPPASLGDLPPFKAGLVLADMPAPVRHRLRAAFAASNEELFAMPGIDFRWAP